MEHIFKMRIYNFITLISFIGITLAAPGKLPADYKTCQATDVNLNACLKDAISDVIPRLFNGKGEPSLGVFPLDPLFIPAIDIGKNEKSSVNINLKFRNISLIGLNQLKVTDVQADLENFQIIVQGYVPQFTFFQGKYEMDGRVLILPVQGKGDCKLTMEHLNATMTMSGKEKRKNGMKYMDIKELTLRYSNKNVKMRFDGLFSQDGKKRDGQVGAIGDAINKFLNENWQIIETEVKPSMEIALAAVFKEISSRVFNKVPFDRIFVSPR